MTGSLRSEDNWSGFISYCNRVMLRDCTLAHTPSQYVTQVCVMSHVHESRVCARSHQVCVRTQFKDNKLDLEIWVYRGLQSVWECLLKSHLITTSQNHRKRKTRNFRHYLSTKGWEDNMRERSADEKLLSETSYATRDDKRPCYYFSQRSHVITSRASVAQLVRARDCQSLGRRFDSV